MSSLAQEESRSISENVTRGWRKRISDGKVSVGYAYFLGYEKGTGDRDNQLRIVEDEVRIVREIYALFLDGQTPSNIAAILTERGIPTPAGKVKWTNSTIRSILTNEKYKGDSLLQKTFKPDFLSKTQVNRGEVPQFYEENIHPAIVTPEVFDLVQYEMARRSQKGKHTSATSIFSNRWSGERAARTLAARSGTATIHTAALCGGATESTTKARIVAVHTMSERKRSRQLIRRPLGRCLNESRRSSQPTRP